MLTKLISIEKIAMYSLESKNILKTIFSIDIYRKTLYKFINCQEAVDIVPRSQSIAPFLSR